MLLLRISHCNPLNTLLFHSLYSYSISTNLSVAVTGMTKLANEAISTLPMIMYLALSLSASQPVTSMHKRPALKAANIHPWSSEDHLTLGASPVSLVSPSRVRFTPLLTILGGMPSLLSLCDLAPFSSTDSNGKRLSLFQAIPLSCVTESAVTEAGVVCLVVGDERVEIFSESLGSST